MFLLSISVQSLEEKEGQSKEYQCQLEQAMEAMKRELEEGKIEFSRKIDTLQQEVILLQTKIEAERAEGRKQLLVRMTPCGYCGC